MFWCTTMQALDPHLSVDHHWGFYSTFHGTILRSKSCAWSFTSLGGSIHDFKIIYSIFHWMSWWLLMFLPEQEIRILHHQNTDNLYHKDAATWVWWAWNTSIYLWVSKDKKSSQMQSCLGFAQWLVLWSIPPGCSMDLDQGYDDDDQLRRSSLSQRLMW